MSPERLSELPADRTPDSTISGMSILRKLTIAAALTGIPAALAEGARRLELWRGADIGIGTLASLERSLPERRERFATAYFRNPELAEKTDEVAQLFVATELARFLREHPREREISREQFILDEYGPFMRDVRTNFLRRQQATNPQDPKNHDALKFGTPSVALIANVKLALHDRLAKDRPPHYWGEKSNIVDLIRTGDYQCRSGSRMLLLALLENADALLQEGERLVVIYSNHHVQVGLLTPERRVIAFEMTKSEKGIQDLGSMEKIEARVFITDAKHELTQAALNTQAHSQETVLLKNFSHTDPPFKNFADVFDKRGEFGGGAIRVPEFRFGIGGGKTSTTDQYGFGDGRIEIPDQRIPITGMDYIPARLGTRNGIYDTVRDVRREYADLHSRMRPEELLAVQRFEQHSPVYSRSFHLIDEHIRSMRRFKKNGNQENFSREFDQLMNEVGKLREYIESNHLDEVYEEYHRSLKAVFDSSDGTITIRYPTNPRQFLREALEIVKQL